MMKKSWTPISSLVPMEPLLHESVRSIVQGKFSESADIKQNTRLWVASQKVLGTGKKHTKQLYFIGDYQGL